MKNLLLTTAILTLSGLVPIGQANASSDKPSTKIDYMVVYQSIGMTARADNMHKGDFMSIARSMKHTALYTGHGSAKMSTVRINTY